MGASMTTERENELISRNNEHVREIHRLTVEVTRLKSLLEIRRNGLPC